MSREGSRGAWGRTLTTVTEEVFQPEGQTSGVGSRASVPSSFSHLPTPASLTSSPRYPSDGSIISRKTCEGRPVHFSLKPTTQQLAGRMFPGAVDPGRVDGEVTVEEVGQGLPPVAAVGLKHPSPPPLFPPPLIRRMEVPPMTWTPTFQGRLEAGVPRSPLMCGSITDQGLI